MKPKRIFEGFDAQDQYKYLEKLPENNTWSKETQEAYKLKIKQIKPDETDEQLNRELTAYMPIASEEEAKYYIQNGNWPWDNYIIETINSLKTTNDKFKNMNVTELQKIRPNRFIYKLFIAPETSPQLKVINKLNTDGYNITDNEILKCENNNPSLHNTATPNTDITPNATPVTTASPVDSTIFEKITGLKFDGTPCNICDQASIMNGTCSFSMEGQQTPVAFNIFTGKDMNNSITSSPSLIQDENKITLPSMENTPTNMS